MKTVLVVLNLLFALALFHFYFRFSYVETQHSHHALWTVQKSGALNTNTLAQYVASQNIKVPPWEILENSTNITSGIFISFILPAIGMCIFNAVVMAIYWKPKCSNKVRNEMPT